MDTVDSLPELYPYRDEGCALSPSCLHCPFPSCLDERPRGRQGWLKEQRSQEIARLHSQGKSTRDLARIFGISQRTIQRALAATPSRHCEEAVAHAL
ncbi:MAG: helix-turn-helix domain-containing protein [Dehalococcoidia bacterium]|nr:helix-turn-helix domain-containing protein [Dehalococcoidia bacterium]